MKRTTQKDKAILVIEAMIDITKQQAVKILG
jgi:hypothetical protein